jgi:hypothetical protein
MKTKKLALPIFGGSHPESSTDTGKHHDGAMAILDAKLAEIETKIAALASAVAILEGAKQ